LAARIRVPDRALYHGKPDGHNRLEYKEPTLRNATVKTAVLMTMFSMTLAITACKKNEPEKTAAPAPTVPVVPPAQVAAPIPSAAVVEEPAPASIASTAPGATTAPSKGSSTSRGNRAPVLRAVRSATQTGFDRLVFEFDTAGLPAWRAEYVDRPVVDCGSGEPVRVAGAAWLQITFTGAQAHSEQGTSTSGPRRRKLSHKVARELVRICDFEGEVTYVVGVERPNPYTPRTMSAPSRLVIDLAH
jgi:hypothetical protein